MKLTQDQIRILRDGRIEDNRFYLQGQLDRKQYQNINEVLETIQLKWSRKEKAHIVDGFSEEDLKNAVMDIIETGEVETLKETIKKFQFYETPTDLTKYMERLLETDQCQRILEPSAGHGAIASTVDYGTAILTCCELDLNKCEILKEKLSSKVDIINIDFLEYTPEVKFDRIIMNPPYSKRQDYKHIRKAIGLLQEGGKLVGLMSKGILFREDYKDLKEAILEHGYIEELEPGTFKESGTMVGTCLVVYNK